MYLSSIYSRWPTHALWQGSFWLSALLLCALVNPAWAGSEDQDPWEGFNRRIFAFNDLVDRVILRPVAVTYQKLTPQPVRRGVGNAFSNIMEVPSAVNGLLQAKPKAAGQDLGRFVINTTLGLAGLFDVATPLGLEGRDQEDFGQTLAVWGVKQGPYLMLPLLGPSTARDLAGMPVDWVLDPSRYIENDTIRYSLAGLELIHSRAEFLELEKQVSGDRYLFIRDIYMQRREHLINDGNVEDQFGAELGEDYFDYESFENEDSFGGEDPLDEEPSADQ